VVRNVQLHLNCGLHVKQHRHFAAKTEILIALLDIETNR
jgi:hypothetical protein